MAPTRLINTQTLAFETRFAPLRSDDPRYPRFAIISHRWEDQEISYQEFLYFTSSLWERNKTVARVIGLDLSKENGKGFAKVKSACSIAKSRGYNWLWIDSCCINKDSSAELSEAINSMYEWYRDAAECLVYLSTLTAAWVDYEDFSNPFWECEWWHRGWTLQELVAPQRLSFWDQAWQYLISRHDISDSIASKTGIPSECLGSQDQVRSTAIATRMSWAGSRRTSRIEDTAYSLLGICNINMPLLYGEGLGAFRRLQEAIITKSNDESIFAVNNTAGLFATSPSDFSPYPMVRKYLCKETRGRTFSIVQSGVRMRISYLDMGASVWAVIFNCKYVALDQPFIRLFQVVPPGYNSQTSRLEVVRHEPGDDVLQRAYNMIAHGFNNMTDVYKHGKAILIADSTYGVNEDRWWTGDT